MNLIIALYRMLLFQWKVDLRICSTKSSFFYNYWLVHYFSGKNNRWILFKRKITEKVDDSDFTEIYLILPTWANVFVQADGHYR